MWGGWGAVGGARVYGPGVFGNATTSTTNQPVGHLVVDIFDSSNHQLLFRGISDDNLSKHADKNTKNLNKNVDKMFDKFPPKANG